MSFLLNKACVNLDADLYIEDDDGEIEVEVYIKGAEDVYRIRLRKIDYTGAVYLFAPNYDNPPEIWCGINPDDTKFIPRNAYATARQTPESHKAEWENKTPISRLVYGRDPEPRTFVPVVLAWAVPVVVY